MPHEPRTPTREGDARRWIRQRRPQRLQPATFRGRQPGRARSWRKIARVIDTVATVLAEAPWLEAKVLQPAKWRHTRAEARARLLSKYILQVAEEHPEEVGSRLWDAENGADNWKPPKLDAVAEVVAVLLASFGPVVRLERDRGRRLRVRRQSEGSALTDTAATAAIKQVEEAPNGLMLAKALAVRAEADDYLARAHATAAPVLKAGYLALAEGKGEEPR
jgi:hypothetical protein